MTFMFMVIFVLIYTIITVRDVRTVLNIDREKAPPKENSTLHKNYKYGHLGSWDIKSTLCEGFLY